MLTPDVITYYSSLLIMQYASLGNAVGTVQAYIGELLQNQIVSQVDTSFDVNTAVGNQLNILGTYRGANREVFGIANRIFWAMIPYTDPVPNSYSGWVAYTDPAPTWNWLQYQDSGTFSVGSTLTDSQLRRLILFLAAWQSSPLTLGVIDNILYASFGVYVNLLDNKNMTITYQHHASDPDPDALWGILVLAAALPHPSGVSFNVVTI